MILYGAWTQDYYLSTPIMGGNGGRLQFAVASIQEELIYNGFNPVSVRIGTFDTSTRAATLDYQRKNGLKADGIVGPITARSLCQKRIYDCSTRKSVNPRLTAGIIRVESSYDFGAVGFVDHTDRGLGQINATAHPSISDAQAFYSPFSINWVADYLRMALKDFQDDECAIASYNLGLRGALAWCKDKANNVAAQAYVSNVMEGA